MAGHSKWSNIKRKKGVQDAKRGKIFMRHSRDIYTAAKEGGGDIEMNPGLRLAVEKARDANMPNDNIERAIGKATGTLEGVRYEEVTYEGYGPGGIAVIVNALTDNRNRTAAEFRHAFRKNNGNLGESGSVSFMFDRKGYIVILNKDNQIDEDEITFAAIEAGADDIELEDEVIEIYTAPENFKSVSDELINSGYVFEESEITLIPQTFNQVSKEEEQQTLDLVELLEDNEAAQDVHHNLEISE